MALPTNYRDDVLDTSVNTKRKFTMIDNGDGTYSFDDETVYSVVGSDYGASDINRTNQAVNNLNAKVDFITGGFLLKDVSVGLSTKTFTYEDERITADSLALVFFDSAQADTISDAGVIANTTAGAIVFTNDTAISTTITCDIYIVGDPIEEEDE